MANQLQIISSLSNNGEKTEDNSWALIFKGGAGGAFNGKRHYHKCLP